MYSVMDAKSSYVAKVRRNPGIEVAPKYAKR